MLEKQKFKSVKCLQIHSDHIAVVDKHSQRTIKNCDGLITNIRNIKLCVKTADCLPIKFRDNRRKVVSIVHAGWKGTLKNISGRALKIFIERFKSNPKDVKVFIGPHIHKESYLVKKDVYSKFSKKYSEFFKKVNPTQWQMDLAGINSEQLTKQGVSINNIRVSKIDTFVKNKYPSFRRDGRMVGLMSCINLN